MPAFSSQMSDLFNYFISPFNFWKYLKCCWGALERKGQVSFVFVLFHCVCIEIMPTYTNQTLLYLTHTYLLYNIYLMWYSTEDWGIYSRIWEVPAGWKSWGSLETPLGWVRGSVIAGSDTFPQTRLQEAAFYLLLWALFWLLQAVEQNMSVYTNSFYFNSAEGKWQEMLSSTLEIKCRIGLLRGAGEL